MSKHCYVPDCSGNNWNSFHRFPTSRPLICKMWVNSINTTYRVRLDHRMLTRPSSGVCGKHFTEDCYEIRPGVMEKVLKKGAVPTIFNLPSSHDDEDGNQSNKSVSNLPIAIFSSGDTQYPYKCNEQPEEELVKAVPEHTGYNGLMKEHSYCLASQNVNIAGKKDTQEIERLHVKASYSNCKVTQVNLPSQSTIRLRKEIKCIRQRLKRSCKKTIKQAQLIKDLKQKLNEKQDIKSLLADHFIGFPLHFICSLYDNANIEKNARRYSILMKEFAIKLYRQSPKAYRFMNSLFNLPHIDRVKHWIGFINKRSDQIGDFPNCLNNSLDTLSTLEDILKDTHNNSELNKFSDSQISCGDIKGLEIKVSEDIQELEIQISEDKEFNQD